MIGGKRGNFKGVKGAESRRVARSDREAVSADCVGSEEDACRYAESEENGGPAHRNWKTVLN